MFASQLLTTLQVSDCFTSKVTSTTKCVATFVVVSPMDFTAMNQLLRIEACEDNMVCVTIPVVNDFILEETESFSVTLDRTENIPIGVMIDSAEAVVQISKSKFRF